MPRNTTTLTTCSLPPAGPDPLVTLSQLQQLPKAQDRHLEGTLLNIQEYNITKYKEFNSRFDAIATSLEHLKYAEQRAEARSRNRLCTRLFHLIQAVKVSGRMPEYFPKNVGAFCKLGRPENLRALASLLTAYEFTDWEDWEEDDDSEGRLKLKRDDQTVAEFYVERHPQAAHFELASRIGLDYISLKDEMERLEHYDESTTGGIQAKRKVREGINQSSGPIYMSDASSLTEEILHPFLLFRRIHIMAPILPSNKEIISFCEERNLGGLRVVRFSDTIIVKFGVDVTAAEAETQRYVWRHTNPNIFRVPEPYRFFQDESQGPALTTGYLVMEYLDGICLSTYLNSTTSQDQKTVVNSILKALHHLAAIPLPVGQGPGPVGGGPPRGYLWGDGGIVSSFASISEMDSWLNDILKYQPGLSTDKFDFTSEKLVMCHADLAPRNILWLGDGRLALLDWGNAGFYPQVFEIYAFRTRINREAIFTKILPQLVQQRDYEEQIQRLGKIENILLRYGDSINFNMTHRTPFTIGPGQVSAPPPFAPGSRV